MDDLGSLWCRKVQGIWFSGSIEEESSVPANDVFGDLLCARPVFW